MNLGSIFLLDTRDGETGPTGVASDDDSPLLHDDVTDGTITAERKSSEKEEETTNEPVAMAWNIAASVAPGWSGGITDAPVLSTAATPKNDDLGDGSEVAPGVEPEEYEGEQAETNWDLAKHVMLGLVEVKDEGDEEDMLEQRNEERGRQEAWNISASVAPSFFAAREEPPVEEDEPGGAETQPEEEGAEPLVRSDVCSAGSVSQPR
jgi:hypothetical protein